MKTHYNFIAILCLSLLLNCKNENTLSEYKFTNREMVLDCDGEDSKLLNEALYAFEDDIRTFYANNYYSKDGDLYLFYSDFIVRDIKGMVIYENLISPHTLEVFNVLKSKSEMWNLENNVSKLNYYSPFFNCIAANVEDKNLKTTLNALLSTHSMSPRLFTSPLTTQSRIVASDPYLRAYVAFDLFYAKLFDIDVTKVKEHENQVETINFNNPNIK